MSSDLSVSVKLRATVLSFYFFLSECDLLRNTPLSRYQWKLSASMHVKCLRVDMQFRPGRGKEAERGQFSTSG